MNFEEGTRQENRKPSLAEGLGRGVAAVKVKLSKLEVGRPDTYRKSPTPWMRRSSM